MLHPLRPQWPNSWSQVAWQRAGAALGVITLGLCWVNPSQVAAADQQTPTFTAEIDKLANEALRKRAAPGLSMAVAQSDGTVTSRHYGRSAMPAGDAVTKHTVFRVGSISKLVTAAVIMKLVEEKRLNLSAPVNTLFPEKPEIAALPASVTVEHLLNHTSGLPDYTRAELEAGIAAGRFTDDDLAVVLGRRLGSTPGESWVYADAPYRLLSLLVERVSGLPYNRYISERFSPRAGLPSLAPCDLAGTKLAKGYIAHSGGFKPEKAYLVRGLLGEGGLCATAEDLARLPAALISGKWITSASVARMTQPTRLSGGSLVDYGFGVRGGLLGDAKAWGHTGGGPDGAWATVAHYPSKGFTVAVVANGTGSDIDASTLQAEVATAVVGSSQLRDAEMDAGLLAAVGGLYARGESMTCVATSEREVTRSRVGSQKPPTKLMHQGGAIFGRSDYPADRVVFQIESDKAIAHSVYYDGLFSEHWRRAPASAEMPGC